MAEEQITMYVDELLIQIMSGLIIAAIIGAASSFFIMYKCIHKQAQDMQLMKKATAFVLRRQVQETKALHPESKQEIEDLEKTYNDLVKNDNNNNSK